MITKQDISAYNANYGGLRGAKILEFYMEQCDFDPHQYWPTFRMQKGKEVFKFIPVSYTHLTLPTNREV